MNESEGEFIGALGAIEHMFFLEDCKTMIAWSFL